MFWIGSDGRILGVSDAVCEFLGYRREDLLAFFIWDINRDFSAKQWPAHWDSLRQARQIRFQARHFARDGSPREIEVVSHYVDIGDRPHICATVSPLTEAQRAVGTWRENEAWLALALDVSGQAPFEIDLVSEMARLSPAHEALFGREPTEHLVSRDVWQAWAHPDDQARVAALYEACVEGRREDMTAEFRMRHAAGHWIWVRTAARVVQCDEFGRPTRMLGTHMDITESKRVEEALKLTQLSNDRASIGITWHDHEGRLVYANDEACRSLGYQREELLGCTVDTFNPDYPIEKVAELWDWLRKEGVGVIETRHKRKNGESFPVEVIANYIAVGDKEFALTFIRDISNRKKSEQTIRASEAFLDSIISQSPLPLVIFDRSGAVVRANRAAFELFRVTGATDALNGYNLFEDDRLRDGDSRTQFQRVLSEGLTVRLQIQFELRQSPGGAVLHLDTTAFPLRNAEGEITHLALTFLDITDLKAAEARLRFHLESEQALADISALMLKPGWDDIDDRVDWMLRRIGELTRADRAFLFDVSADGRTATNTHEWCGPGTVPQIGDLQRLQTADYAPFYDHMLAGRAMCVRTHDSDFDLRFKPALLEPGPHSLICIPVIAGARLLGVLGLDAVTRQRPWSEIDMRFLRLAAEILAHTWQHRESYRAQQEHVWFLESLDSLSRILTRTERDESLLADLTREVRTIFRADRAYLLHPCDPDAAVVEVTVEDSLAPYAGPPDGPRMVRPNATLRAVFRQALARTGPVLTGFEPESEDFQQFGTRSRMAIALHPRSREAWQLGLHQCASERDWTAAEQRLFQSIAERIADALSGALLRRQLMESEGRYRAVFDNTIDSVIVHDADGRILTANQAMLEMYDLEDHDVPSQTIPDLCAPGFSPAEFAQIWGDVMEGQIKRFEIQAMRPKSGSVFPVEVMLRAIPYGDRQAILANVRDITDRARAEEALRQSEERFAKAFRASPAPTAIVSRNTARIIDVNERWLSVHGFTRDEVVNRTSREIGLWPDLEARTQAHAVIERTGSLTDFPVRIRSKSGEVRHQLWSAESVTLSGEPVLLSYVQDITERTKAEEALRQSEERFAKAFRANPAAMLISRIDDGRIIDANDRWLTLFETTREALVGKTTLDVGLWKRAEDRSETIAGLRAEGMVRDVPVVFYTPAGKPREILWSAETISLGDERVFLSSIHDLTEQKRTERALRESEARLSAAVESIPFDFFLLDTTGRYVLQNSASRARWGDILGQMAADTTVHRGQDIRWGPRFDAVLGGAVADEELRVTLDGGERFFRNVLAPVLEDGAVRGIVELTIDVTARKRAESELETYREHLEDLVSERTTALQQAMSQLMQAEKLASLGNLVAGLAHELNTPLGNARMVATTLGEHFRDLAAGIESGALRRSQLMSFLQTGRESVDLLERNTVRAADLISHVKEVAIDQTSVRRRAFNLARTIEDVLSTLRPTLKRTEHRIETDVPADLDLDSYPGPLEQIVANLVSNALAHAFTDMARGLIRITARAVGPDAVRLVFSDDGVGIPPDIRARIFDPFFTTRLGQGGSGLGLYIVYSLVTGALGGQIEVESDPGQAGTTFTLTLPRRAPDRQADARAE
nr:PAS domain S-box protein [Roseospira navarrensis]